MKLETIEDLLNFFIDVFNITFQLQSHDILSLSTSLFSTIICKVIDNSDQVQNFNDFFLKIVNISNFTNEFNDEYFIKFWNSISKLNSLSIFEDFLINDLTLNSLKICNDNNQSILRRSLVLDSLYPIIQDLSSYSEEILSSCLDICSSFIEEDHIMPLEILEHFEAAVYYFPRDQIYPLIQSCIINSLNSESISHQTSALLIFRIIITVAPDCAQKDISFILEFIQNALHSNELILQEAACTVLEVFSDGYQSLNCFGPQFLPQIVPLLISESSDLRTHAYKALFGLMEKMDATIPRFSSDLLKLLDQIPENDLSNFIRIVTRAIDLSEDFDDEQCDTVLELIFKVLESNNIEYISSSFQIGISLLKQDEVHIEIILEHLLPSVNIILEMDQHETNSIIIDTIQFLGDVSLYLRDTTPTIIGPYIDKISNFLKNEKSSIRNSSLVSISKILKYCLEYHSILLPLVISQIDSNFLSEKESSQDSAIESLNLLRKILEPDSLKLFYERLFDIILSETSRPILISNCLISASKLINSSNNTENLNYFGNLGMQLLTKIEQIELPILDGKPLLRNGVSTFLFNSICRYFKSLLSRSQGNSDQICLFLLPWFSENSELDHFAVSGTFIEAIKSNSVSQQIRQTILEAIVNDISFATDPSLQQNIVYFLNLLLQITDEFILPIIDIIPSIEKWRQVAKDSKFGYQDVLANISSLYLTLSNKYDNFDLIKINYALQEFPPSDLSECLSMSKCIINLFNKRNILNEPVLNSMGLAIARFIVWEDSLIEKSHLPEDIFNSLINIFRNLCQNNESLIKNIERIYLKTKGKFKKISTILNE